MSFVRKQCAAFVFLLGLTSAHVTQANPVQNTVWLKDFLSKESTDTGILRFDPDVAALLHKFLPSELSGRITAAFALQYPQLHAGEPALVLGCRTERDAWILEGPANEDRLGAPKRLEVSHFDRFVSGVRTWQPAKRLELPRTAGIDEQTRAMNEGYVALLSVVYEGSVHHVPIRGWELFGVFLGHPVQPSRLQRAFEELEGKK